MEKNDDGNSTVNYDISYDTLWKAIIRPPRNIYLESELIDRKFSYKNKKYIRKDFDIKNLRGEILKCSMVEPFAEERVSEIMPLVIYLHGNSSSRLEGFRMVPVLLKRGINLFVFDFSGSGLSDGEYISLGWYEKEDLKTVVKFASQLPGVGKIGLWGRSMGAATALFYDNSDGNVACSVYDSPFAEFRLLVQQLCANYKGLPFWLVNFAMFFIKKTIKSKHNLDIDELNPIKYSKKHLIPGFFIHAMNDELIPLDHTLKIFEEYRGEKILNICDGGHNSRRKSHILDKIGAFFIKNLMDEENGEKFSEIRETIMTECNEEIEENLPFK